MSESWTQLVDPLILYTSSLTTNLEICDSDNMNFDLPSPNFGYANWDLDYILDPSSNAIFSNTDEAAQYSPPPPVDCHENVRSLEMDQPAWPQINWDAVSSPQVETIAPSNLNKNTHPTNCSIPNAIASAEHVQGPPQESQLQETIPRKCGRKRKPLSLEAKEAKRKNFLERNRLAANRCRGKKREWIYDLEEKAGELQSSNTRLVMEKSELFETTKAMREILTSCGDCVVEGDNSAWIETQRSEGDTSGELDNVGGDLVFGDTVIDWEGVEAGKRVHRVGSITEGSSMFSAEEHVSSSASSLSPEPFDSSIRNKDTI